MPLAWLYNGSYKLVALELHNNCSCIVTTKLHELHTYTVPHMMNCICCNSCNSSNNTHVVKIWWVIMKLLIDVKINSCKIILHYCNNKFALHMHTFISFTFFSTNLTLPFIKTLDSWLFHIIRISTSEYVIKNSKNKITIHFIILWYYKKFTQQYKHKIHYRNMCLSISLKTWIKITAESHVLLKKIPKQ
jgi:hypothetical protein